MKIKAGNTISAGDLVTVKPEDYNAPVPTGEELVFTIYPDEKIFCGIAVVESKD